MNIYLVLVIAFMCVSGWVVVLLLHMRKVKSNLIKLQDRLGMQKIALVNCIAILNQWDEYSKERLNAVPDVTYRNIMFSMACRSTSEAVRLAKSSLEEPRC